MEAIDEGPPGEKGRLGGGASGALPFPAREGPARLRLTGCVPGMRKVLVGIVHVAIGRFRPFVVLADDERIDAVLRATRRPARRERSVVSAARWPRECGRRKPSSAFRASAIRRLVTLREVSLRFLESSARPGF